MHVLKAIELAKTTNEMRASEGIEALSAQSN